MNIDFVLSTLKEEEGFVPYAYADHLGFWTIGYGRMIDQKRGGGISKYEAEMLLENDVSNVCRELDRNIPGWRVYPDDIPEALVFMAFQMGTPALLKFKNMLQAMKDGDREKAAQEALDSRWAKQTPARAERVAKMIRGE